MINYVSISDLLAEHETQMSSYYQSGVTDTGFLYPLTNRLLGLIGVKILPIKEEVLYVSNYGVDLPNDYNSLILLLSATSQQTSSVIPSGQFTYEQSVCDTEIACKDSSFQLINEFGRYAVVQRIPIETITSSHTTIVVLGTKLDNCKNPFNSKKYDAEIKNGRILTQFETGVLYMQYRALIANDNDILIPDYSEITNWILMEWDKALLKHLYYNTTLDVSQRLQYSDKELHIAKENARTFWKRHEVQDYNDLKNALQNDFVKKSRINKDRTHFEMSKFKQPNWIV
jgi:hypothetical protein